MSEKIETYTLGTDSIFHEGVPQGKVTKYEMTSKIYPDVIHDYQVYVPAAYDESSPACVMIFQDGSGYAAPDGPIRVPTVFDNLICKNEIPVIIGIFVDPGRESEAYINDPRDFFAKYPFSQRAEEYDVLNGRYASFLLEEILPLISDKYNIRKDADGRAICGMSSGGICAFTASWERPDAFGKVLSHCGSFADIRGGNTYPCMIRKVGKKPIRVYLQGGENDLNVVWGDWKLANLEMASALEFKGYDYKFVMGTGGHDLAHGGSIFPDSLRWLWRDKFII